MNKLLKYSILDRKIKIENFINLLRESINPNDPIEQNNLLHKAQLTNLTEEEIKYIERELND